MFWSLHFPLHVLCVLQCIFLFYFSNKIIDYALFIHTIISSAGKDRSRILKISVIRLIHEMEKLSRYYYYYYYYYCVILYSSFR